MEIFLLAGIIAAGGFCGVIVALLYLAGCPSITSKVEDDRYKCTDTPDW